MRLPMTSPLQIKTGETKLLMITNNETADERVGSDKEEVTNLGEGFVLIWLWCIFSTV